MDTAKALWSPTENQKQTKKKKKEGENGVKGVREKGEEGGGEYCNTTKFEMNSSKKCYST